MFKDFKLCCDLMRPYSLIAERLTATERPNPKV